MTDTFFVLKEYVCARGAVQLRLYPWKNEYEAHLIQDGKTVDNTGWNGDNSFADAETAYDLLINAVKVGAGIEVGVPKDKSAETTEEAH